MREFPKAAVVLLVSVGILTATAAVADPPILPPQLTHGPQVGGVTETSAKVWFRVEPEAEVWVEYGRDPGLRFGGGLAGPFSTSASRDYTGEIEISGLEPASRYYYRVFVAGVGGRAVSEFVTFPTRAKSARLAFLADAAAHGTIPSAAVAAAQPDFVIVLGDWPHWNPTSLAASRWMHRAMRGPETPLGEQIRDDLLRRFPVEYVWDDHDYGGNNTDKTLPSRATALQAFDEYWPTYEHSPSGLWRKVSYGGLVDVFLLDLRSQRDPNSYLDPRFIPDGKRRANRDEIRDDSCRSMLDGDACPQNRPKGQKAWLLNGLARSTAEWKIIASTVPWNPTTIKDDAWWDFRAERRELMQFIEDQKIEGVLVVSADIHSGGAIDDGTHSGLPELSIPTTWERAPIVTCGRHQRRAPGAPIPRCVGHWSQGLALTGTGFAVIDFERDSARVQTLDLEGAPVADVRPLALWKKPWIEAGSTIAGSGWRTVTLERPFRDPVVAVGPASARDTEPMTLRVRAIRPATETDPASFEVRVYPWNYLDNRHGPEEITYLVAERGSHLLPSGRQIEAGSAAVTHRPTRVHFKNKFTGAPGVVTSVASSRGSDAVGTAVSAVTGYGFRVRLQEEEAADGAHRAERVDYIAFSMGPASPQDPFDWSSMQVEVSHAAAPLPPLRPPMPSPCLLADVNSRSGGNPATLRVRPGTGMLQIQEEQSADLELWHQMETVAVMAFECRR